MSSSPTIAPPRTSATRSPTRSVRPEATGRIGRWPGGIFWRTFLLIAILIGASLLAWYQSFRILERSPRAEQAAQLVVSIVNLTRSALVHSDPEKRRSLLIDLAQNEGIRIYALESSDQIAPLPDEPFLRIIERYVRTRLGEDTRISLSVNGQAGLWVSFSIDDDGYWVAFDPSRLEAVPRIQWLGWSAVALALSLLGALFISRLINLPLARLATAAVAIGRGARPDRLPTSGPREIRDANASFNAMVTELERIEADRALLLAGISHDLRTPLTRLRLEIELNPIDDDTRMAMTADVDQMDAIIGQFLDYARPLNAHETLEQVDLAELVRGVVANLNTGSDLEIILDCDAAAPIAAQPTEVRRILLNLIENARKYGRREDDSTARVDIRVFPAKGSNGAVLEVRDYGPGIPEARLDGLKRPFTRMDSARSQASGAGLGLAIIERIAQRHRARFDLSSAPGEGLTARVTFPRVS